jgi:hypothetical protein
VNALGCSFDLVQLVSLGNDESGNFTDSLNCPIPSNSIVSDVTADGDARRLMAPESPRVRRLRQSQQRSGRSSAEIQMKKSHVKRWEGLRARVEKRIAGGAGQKERTPQKRGLQNTTTSSETETSSGSDAGTAYPSASPGGATYSPFDSIPCPAEDSSIFKDSVFGFSCAELVGENKPFENCNHVKPSLLNLYLPWPDAPLTDFNIGRDFYSDSRVALATAYEGELLRNCPVACSLEWYCDYRDDLMNGNADPTSAYAPACANSHRFISKSDQRMTVSVDDEYYADLYNQYIEDAPSTCAFFASIAAPLGCYNFMQNFRREFIHISNETYPYFAEHLMRKCPDMCSSCPVRNPTFEVINPIVDVLYDVNVDVDNSWNESGAFEKSYRIRRQIWECFESNSIGQVEDPDPYCLMAFSSQKHYGYSHISASSHFVPFECLEAVEKPACFGGSNYLGSGQPFYTAECEEEILHGVNDVSGKSCILGAETQSALMTFGIAVFYSHFSLLCLLFSTHPAFSDVIDASEYEGWRTLSGSAGNVVCPSKPDAQGNINLVAGFVSPEAGRTNALGMFTVYMPDKDHCDLTVSKNWYEVFYTSENSTFQEQIVTTFFGESALCLNVADLTGEPVLGKNGSSAAVGTKEERTSPVHCTSATVFSGTPSSLKTGFYRCCVPTGITTRIGVASAFGATFVTAVVWSISALLVASTHGNKMLKKVRGETTGSDIFEEDSDKNVVGDRRIDSSPGKVLEMVSPKDTKINTACV